MLKIVRDKSRSFLKRLQSRIIRQAFGEHINAIIAMRLQQSRDEFQQELAALENRVAVRLLALRDRLASNDWQQDVPANVRTPAGRDLEADLATLKLKFPGVFPVWHRLFENARIEYDTNPKDSLSVEGNPGAEAFRQYLAPELRGRRILDIGCGPQPLPHYLRGGHSAAISGIDPLSSSADREFDFVRGLAEFLPWSDNVFDVVVVGTSLDHAISLEMTFSEICRVLAPGGVCIIWLGFVPGAPKYNPYATPVTGIDAHHIFHFDKPWFLDVVKNYFTIRDEFKLDEMNHFYTLSPLDR